MGITDKEMEEHAVLDFKGCAADVTGREGRK